MCVWEAKVGQYFAQTEGVRFFLKVKLGHFCVGADKAHSLTGKLSEKHAFLDMTQGHDEVMTET